MFVVFSCSKSQLTVVDIKLFEVARMISSLQRQTNLFRPQSSEVFS